MAASEIRGWKQITDRLGVGETKARDLAKRDVHRLPVRWDWRGPFLDEAEFVAWAAEETRRQTAAHFPDGADS